MADIRQLASSWFGQLMTMLNIPLADVDHVARPIVAIGTDYSPGTLLDFHTHRRAQVLYGKRA